MTREQYLLTCMVEECAEVAQRATKALRFGLDEVQEGQSLNNAERIEDECNDLLTLIFILCEEGFLSLDGVVDDYKADRKMVSLEKYMKYAKSKGTVDESADTDFTRHHVSPLRRDSGVLALPG